MHTSNKKTRKDFKEKIIWMINYQKSKNIHCIKKSLILLNKQKQIMTKQIKVKRVAAIVNLKLRLINCRQVHQRLFRIIKKSHTVNKS